MTDRLAKLLLLGCVTLLPAPGLRAQVAPADSARALLAAADSAAAAATPAGYHEAIRLRRLGAAISARLGDRRGEAQALSRIGNAWHLLGEPDSARSYALEAFPKYLEVADTNGAVRTLSGLLAVAFEALGQRDSALATYRRAWRLAELTGDPALQARVAQNLGGLYIDLSQADSAFAWSWKTIALSRRTGDFRTEAEILSNLSIVHENLGNTDSALGYGRAAWRLGVEQRSDSLLAVATLNLGSTHLNHGAPDSAMHYFRVAFQSAGRAPRPREQREALLNLGIVFTQLGQGDSARAYYQQAIERARLVNDRGVEARAYNNLGILFNERRQFDSATAAYRRVLEAYRELQYRRGEAIALVNLAGVHFERGGLDSALANARAAYQMSQPLEFPALESAALNILGQVFRSRGEADSAFTYFERDLALSRRLQDLRGEGVTLLSLALLFHTQKSLGRAVAYYDSAATIKSRLALNAGGDFNRTTLGEKEFELYDMWTRAWLDRAGELGEESAAAGALAASERGRAQALLDLMNRAGDTTAAGERPTRGNAVDAVLRGGSSLLVYHASGDSLVAWTAGPGSPLRAHRLALQRDSLARLVKTLRSALGVEQGSGRLAARAGGLEDAGGAPPGNAATPAWRTAAAALSRVLLPASVRSALGSRADILVVPQGVLGLVPFSVLPWGPGGPLLSERVALRYAPSLATALSSEERARAGWGNALIVGNPFMPAVQTGDGERVSLTPLAGAEAEARAVAAKLGAGPVSGPAATETTIRARLGGAGLVHLATHGYAYATEGRARDSFIALAPDSLHDGLLRIGEILDDASLTLVADLVVLSACQTGLGDLKQAEGTVGLQRAFLAKGARSVLVSLWNVSDQATRLLMERFYAHALDDADRPGKAEALRRAQADVRTRPGYSHPRYWAAFQLVGAK